MNELKDVAKVAKPRPRKHLLQAVDWGAEDLTMAVNGLNCSVAELMARAGRGMETTLTRWNRPVVRVLPPDYAVAMNGYPTGNRQRLSGRVGKVLDEAESGLNVPVYYRRRDAAWFVPYDASADPEKEMTDARILGKLKRRLNTIDEKHGYPREGYTLGFERLRQDFRGWTSAGYFERSARKDAKEHPNEFGNTLLEEVGEAFNARTPARVRAELYDVMAVAWQALRHLDTNDGIERTKR
jgi:antitoxin (DNA-binding transcriptional repressor) of toxin-antitoxin stability system